MGALRPPRRPAASPAGVVAWTTARGVVAAMAMTGMREVTTRLGLLQRVPPEAIAEEADNGMLDSLSEDRRATVIQLLHWAYGGAGGALFAALPTRIRRHPAAGPAYGVLVWLAFEGGIAPALGLRGPERPVDRLTLLADHLLYGAVVGTGPR